MAGRTGSAVVRLACLLALLGTCSSGCSRVDTSAPGAATDAQGGAPEVLSVTSEAFDEGSAIPAKYCAHDVGGSNISPPLAWSEPPYGTRSFVVTIIDHHPIANMWVHWVVVGVRPSVTSVAEGASGALAPPVLELTNTFGNARYDGPRPPAGSGDHDYVVTVYALDIDRPDMPATPSSADIDRMLDGHILAQGSLTGVFGR